jgi:hypothetical protein
MTDFFKPKPPQPPGNVCVERDLHVWRACRGEFETNMSRFAS